MKDRISWMSLAPLALALGLSGLLGLAASSFTTSVALAQPAEGQAGPGGDGSGDVVSADPAEDRATAFRAMSGADMEQMPGGPLFAGAYAIVFFALLLYLLRLGGLHRGTQSEIERLRRTIDAAAEKGAR